ncbi:uncharacterized protein O3C94_018983 [Discoglossus pictus]
MSGTMGGKGTFSILVTIVGFLLSGHHVEGQETTEPIPVVDTGLVTTLGNAPNSCPSYEVNVDEYCSIFTGLADLDRLLVNGLDDSDACAPARSLAQYACAGIDKASVSTVVSILKCFTTNINAIVTPEALHLLISKISTETLQGALDILSTQVSVSSFRKDIGVYVVISVLDNIKKSASISSPGFVATWFQERMYPFLPALNSDVLNCVNTLPLSCDSFQAITEAFDVASNNFAESENIIVGSFITKFLREHTCHKSSSSEFIKSYYRNFRNYVSVQDYVAAGSGVDLSSALDVLPPFQVAQYANLTNAFLSLETALPIIQTLEKNDLSYVISFLDTIKGDAISSFNLSVISILLKTVVGKFSTTDQNLCMPNYKDIFQFKISFLLVAVDETVLNELPSNMDCSAFQDIFEAVDNVYDKLEGNNQLAVSNYRINYLMAEAKKSGGACNYGVNSSTWLVNNFGLSISYVSYAELKQLNPSFNGYEALDILNLNQTLDLIVDSSILLEETQYSATQITALTTSIRSRGFIYVYEFLIQFRIILLRFNIVFIKNIQFRSAMLEIIWEVLSSQFSLFSSNDWSVWFNEQLTFFLPSITRTQLDVLSSSVTGNCSNFQVIVEGCDSAFENMDVNTKKEIAKWIGDYLRTTNCESSDWLQLNFRRFVEFVDVSVIVKIDPTFDPIGSLELFSSEQLGQVVIVSEQAQTNVTVITQVFSVLLNGTSEEVISNVGAFWDGLNVAFEQQTTVNFTQEVKYEMLSLTTNVLKEEYAVFTVANYTTWFQVRLDAVVDTIDSSILAEIPLDISCDSFSVLVQTFGGKYDSTAEGHQKDVLNFFNSYQETNKEDNKCTRVDSSVSWIKTYYGEYFGLLSFDIMITYNAKFNAYEDGVLSLMSVTQIGDMIVKSGTLENYEFCTKLFAHLETLSVENVNAIMEQFTQTAIKSNTVITNVEVGQYILESYLRILTTYTANYTSVQYTELFQRRIFLFIKFITRQALDLIIVKNCDSVFVVVVQLNNAFDGLSDQIRKIIVDWILSLLKQSEFNGCRSTTQSQSEWIQTVWLQFFQYVQYTDVVSVYSDYNILANLSEASVNQKAYYLTSSSTLNNVSSVTTVLESLKEDENEYISVTTVTSFLQEFNAAIETQTDFTISYEVKETFMDFLFSSFVVNIHSVQEEYIINFYFYFKYFISGISVQLVELIPVDISCSDFSYIISGLSSESENLSEEVKHAIYKFIIRFLNHNSVSGGESAMVCGNLYTNSKTYVKNIFFSFVGYATFYDFSQFYSSFDVYEVLPLCTGKQLGNILINSTAINNPMEAVPILEEIKKRSIEEISSFTHEINTVAEEKNIQNLPNPVIGGLISTNIWNAVSSKVQTSEEYKLWLGTNLKMVFYNFPTEVIFDLPKNMDCNSQKAVIGEFSSVVDKLSKDQTQAIVSRIKEYQSEKAKLSGSACDSDKSSEEWIESTFGSFRSSFSMAEFKELNKNFSEVAALPECTGTQIAEYVASNNILENASLIITVFENLNTYEEVVEFYTEINTLAATALQTSSQIDIILQSTFETISSSFEVLTEQQIGTLFQETLVNVLPEIKEPQIEIIPTLSCGSYHEALTGFNKAYKHMKEETRELVYEKYIKHQLNRTSTSGVVCGSPDDNPQFWLEANLGSFASYSELSYLLQWNTKIEVTNVIGTLKTEEVAAVLVQPEYINDEELYCQTLGKLKHEDVSEVYVFLNAFSGSFQTTTYTEVPSQAIRAKLMSESVSFIQSQLKHYSSSDWETLLSVQFKPFLSGITKVELDILLSFADCHSYAIIVKYLTGVFDYLSVDTQHGLYQSLFTFRSGAQYAGDSCPGSGGDIKTSLSVDFGKFASLAPYDDLESIHPGFNGLDIIDDLTAEQCGGLILNGNILNNEANANIFAKKLQSFNFVQLDSFLTVFQVNAIQRNLIALGNAQVRGILWNAIYNIFVGQINIFSHSQWIDYFESKLSLLLPGISEAQLEIMDGRDCSILQIIISGLNKVYNSFDSAIQKAIFGKIYSSLSAQHQTTGSACALNIQGNLAWLQTNFGSFSYEGSYNDFISLKTDFSASDALPAFSARQLAQYSVQSSNALQSTEIMRNIFNYIHSNNLGEYLEEFNIVAKQSGLTKLPSVEVRNFMADEIFCKLGSLFSSFSLERYSLWFGQYLHFFISGLSAKNLGSIPKDISCDTLALLSNVFSNSSKSEHPTDVYNFILSVLNAQFASSGSACVSDSVSGKLWVTTYFRSLAYSIQWSDISSVYQSLQVNEVAEFLSGQQLASAVTTTTVVLTIDSLGGVFANFGNDPTMLYTFIKTLRTASIEDSTLLSNVNVKSLILQYSAKVFFSNFGSASVANAQQWISSLDFLLDRLNSTILEEFPLGTPCVYYKSFVSQLNTIYKDLTELQQKDVYTFVKNYLSYQLANNGSGCTVGTSGFADWLVSYVGSNICSQGSAADIQPLNGDFGSAVFNSVCGISS